MTETQTVDLASWLTAIWDEEERAVREWQEKLEAEIVIPATMLGGIVDPAQALARIAADRKILAACERVYRAKDPEYGDGSHDLADEVLSALASPYKGREGWQEAWIV